MATRVFSTIYSKNQWGCGSGYGSLPTSTVKYRAFLSQWMKEHAIKTVLDIGCGDWQSTHLLNWDGITYTGIDCVPSLIEENRQKYGSPNIHFHMRDVLREPITGTYDVIILKDVIQHWPTADIMRVLPSLLIKAKYVLVTNCRFQQRPEQDIALGGFRPLHKNMKPLSSFSPQLLYSYGTKDVLLLRP